MSPGAEQKLSSTLRGFEQRTGHQFVIALFQSLDGESLEDYSNRVFRAWKIGGKQGNDGLLFALYKEDRRWRVEVGYGFEGTLTDLEAAEIAGSGVPYFKRGDFDAGVETVTEGLEARIERRAPISQGPTPVLPSQSPHSYDGRYKDYPAAFLIIMTFSVVMILVQYAAYLFRRTLYKTFTIGRKPKDDFWTDFSSSGGEFIGGGGSGGGGGFSGGGGPSGGGGASGGW